MAGNSRDFNNSFQAAERGLTDGEQDVLNKDPVTRKKGWSLMITSELTSLPVVLMAPIGRLMVVPTKIAFSGQASRQTPQATQSLPLMTA